MKTKLVKLEGKFASNIWQRGKEYYSEGLVRNVVKNGYVVRAECCGNSIYRLKVDLGKGEMSCSCPCDFYCKHLAALIIWLGKNEAFEIDEEVFKKKSKNELIRMLTSILERDPSVFVYTQELSDKAVKELISKVWFSGDVFEKLDFIKENVFRRKKFVVLFLKKLLDMFDHDPDLLYDYVSEYLDEVFSVGLGGREKIKELIKDYPFVLNW